MGSLLSSSAAQSSPFWPLMRVTWAIMLTSAGAMPARPAVMSWTSQASPVGSAIEFDLDPGLLGEGRVDVLVERILEVAAVGADLEGLLRPGPDRRKAHDRGGRERARPGQQTAGG